MLLPFYFFIIFNKNFQTNQWRGLPAQCGRRIRTPGRRSGRLEATFHCSLPSCWCRREATVAREPTPATWISRLWGTPTPRGSFVRASTASRSLWRHNNMVMKFVFVLNWLLVSQVVWNFYNFYLVNLYILKLYEIT